MSTALALREAKRLADLEVTIAQGLATFVEVGAALSEIRDSRLYRQTHGTFEDYCRARWQITDRRARQLISAAETVRQIGTTVPILPATESQARPLVALEPEIQREVWKEAVETAPNGKPTAAHVAATVERMTKPANVVKDTIAAARAEYRDSEEGRVMAYIEALPRVPTAIGESVFDDMHASGIAILRMHASFINRALARTEKIHASA